MALIALGSAKGAPGVTTLAVALAALAPRPAVLADLDPAGGDLALRYPGVDGLPLDPDRGLLSLGATVRRDPAAPVPPHVQAVSGGLEVLVGAASPEQVSALGPVWSVIGRLLRDAPGRDVIADCGRVGAASPALPVLQAADVVLLVVRDAVEQLAHLRDRLATLGPLLEPPVRLAVVVVAAGARRAAGADLQQLLDAAGLRGTVLGVVADDPKGARMLGGATARSTGRTTLVRSARSLLPALYELVDRPLAAPVAQPEEAAHGEPDDPPPDRAAAGTPDRAAAGADGRA